MLMPTPNTFWAQSPFKIENLLAKNIPRCFDAILLSEYSETWVDVL